MLCLQCANFFEVVIENRLSDNEPERIQRCLVYPPLFEKEIPDLQEGFFDKGGPRIFKCTHFVVKSKTH